MPFLRKLGKKSIRESVILFNFVSVEFWCVKSEYFSYICWGKGNISEDMIFLKIKNTLMKDVIPDNFRTSRKSRFELFFVCYANRNKN